MPSSEKLVVILGQTATGKTALAMEVARKHNGAIICADSRTIYKGMDIGTAKPSQDEKKAIQHYLIDVVEPDQSFSVVEFKTLCQKYIAEIRQEGRLPIIVGGSGLYLDAFLYDYKFRSGTGLDVSEMIDDQKLELAQELYPQEILKIDSKNIRRVEQLLTRGPVNTNDRQHIKIPCKIIGLELDKPTLKLNIEKRTAAMLNNGFVQEVEKLREKYGKDCPALLTTGYKEVTEYLDGKIEKPKLESEIVASTLRLAKKQATWFKRNHSIEWCNSAQKAIATIEQYLGEV